MSTKRHQNQSVVIEALGKAPKPYLTKCELVHATGIAPKDLEDALQVLHGDEKVGCRFMKGGMMAWLPDYG